MSDLVDRIRNRPNDAPMPTERLLDEAADEIERLRSALKIVRDDMLADPKEVAALALASDQ